jgi:hypothetical protein
VHIGRQSYAFCAKNTQPLHLNIKLKHTVRSVTQQIIRVCQTVLAVLLIHWELRNFSCSGKPEIIWSAITYVTFWWQLCIIHVFMLDVSDMNLL